jgi:hypothetical protein
MLKRKEYRDNERIEHLRHPLDESQGVYDFSESGIGLYLGHSLLKDDIRAINFKYSEKTLTLKVQVMHCSTYGNKYKIGFQYLAMEKEISQQLREMVNQYSRGVPLKINIQ